MTGIQGRSKRSPWERKQPSLKPGTPATDRQGRPAAFAHQLLILSSSLLSLQRIRTRVREVRPGFKGRRTDNSEVWPLSEREAI